MNDLNQDRERARAMALHDKMNDHLGDYLSDDFEAVVLHSSGTLFAVDQTTADMFGYSVDELLYRNALTFFPAKSGSTMLHQMLGKSNATYTVTARHKDGSLFKIQLKGQDFEAYGEPVRAVQIRRVA
jgi:PAS domain S-box-containing protein